MEAQGGDGLLTVEAGTGAKCLPAEGGTGRGEYGKPGAAREGPTPQVLEGGLALLTP